MPEAIMFSSRINLLWPETSQALLDLALGVLPGYCDKRDSIALIRWDKNRTPSCGKGPSDGQDEDFRDFVYWR